MALLIAYALGPGHVHEHIKIGDKAPLQLEVRSYDGTSWPLSHLATKPLLINFWATWCPPCTSELPLLVQLAKDNRNQLHVLGAAVDSPPADVQNAVKQFAIEFPIAAAPFSLAQAFGAHALPSTYLVGVDHTLLWQKHGALDRKDLQTISQILAKAKKHQ
jgi:thiol-disulfide isomerase/thioredoxin